MPRTISNTSPFQYLQQIGQLDLLPSLVQTILVPPAVVDELAAGRAMGLDLPAPEVLPWVTVQAPASMAALPLVRDLGPGESQALALALEYPEAVVILDDKLGRHVAHSLGIPHTGTLGVLIDAKRAGLIPAVSPLIDRLHACGFRLTARARQAVLNVAGETAR